MTLGILSDAKSWLIWKEPDAGKDWGQEEKGTTENETVGWYHRLDGCGFGWTPGAGDGQGGLACCGSWGCKELDMTEWLNWIKFGTNECKSIHSLGHFESMQEKLYMIQIFNFVALWLHYSAQYWHLLKLLYACWPGRASCPTTVFDGHHLRIPYVTLLFLVLKW